MHRGALWAVVQGGLKELDTTEQLTPTVYNTNSESQGKLYGLWVIMAYQYWFIVWLKKVYRIGEWYDNGARYACVQVEVYRKALHLPLHFIVSSELLHNFVLKVFKEL